MNAISATPPPDRPLELQGWATDLLTQAHGLVITDRPSAERATDCVKLIKALSKKADEERKTWVDPLNNQVSRINAQFKAIIDPLKSAESSVKAKLEQFQREETAREREAARIRQEEEAQALAAAENARAAGAEEVADAIIAEVAAMPDPSIVKAVAPVRSDYGAVASFRKGWAFEVEDAALVPREYLTLDEKKIKAAIAAGVRDISGLTVFETQTTVIR